MTPFMRPIRFVVAVLLCALAAPAQAVSLWIANSAEVRRVELAGGTDLGVPLENVVRLSATRQGGVVALTKHSLVRINSGGEIEASLDVEALGYGSPSLLAVDAHDDTAWVVTSGNLLIRIGRDGALVGGTTLPGKADAIDIAVDGTPWLGGGGALWHVSVTTELLQTYVVDSSPSRIGAMHFDSLRDRAWLVGRHAAAMIDLQHGTSTMAAKLDEPIVSSAFDVAADVLWVLTAQTLLAYGGHGSLLHRESLEEIDLADARAVALEFDTGGVVVASHDRLTLRDAGGADETRAHSLGRDLLLATRPFHLALWLTTQSLSQTTETAGRSLTFSGEVAARCSGVRCALPLGYWQSLKPITSLDGTAFPGEFRIDATSGQYRFTPTATVTPGTHRFSAQVIDRFGNHSNEAELTFSVVESTEGRQAAARPASAEAEVATKAPNRPPAVTITAPANGSVYGAGDSIAITASATDSDGSVSKVEFYRGGNTLIGTATRSPYTIVWNNVAVGSYALTAKAYDNKNGTATSSAIDISVTGNLPPTVSLTAPANGAVFLAGATVTLTAAAADPDGSIARVEFYDGATLLGAGATAPFSFAWTNAAVGNHALTAKAVDNAGASAQSAIVNMVVGQPPLVVVTDPISCSAVDAAANVALEADAVSPTGSIALVEFFDGGSLIGSAAKFPYRYTLQNASVGTHTITARATDNRGVAATSRAVLVTVRSSDQPPSVAITSPTEGATFAAATGVPMSANASDPDGTVASVSFWLDNGGNLSQLRTLNSAPYSFVATGLAAGSYTLTAIAEDDRGVRMTSAPVHFSIATNQPPTVSLTAPMNGATYAAPATLNLAASASDSDGSVAKVEFFAGAALIGSVTAPPYGVTWSNVEAGAYALTAKATDNFGGVSTSTVVSVTVSANAAPTVSIAAPASGGTYFAPANLSIAANAADADGSVARVDFYANGVSIGSATAAPYNVLWTGVAAGAYAISAIATDNGGAQTSSGPVSISVLAGPMLAVASGLDGSTVNDDTVRITGHVTAPVNSAVNINGRIALLDAAGNFSINNVGLLPGTNAIVATITSQGGQSATQTINITSSGQSPFVVAVDPDEGFAPLTTKFTVTNRRSVGFGSVEFDFDDNGTTDFTAVPAYFVNGVLTVQTLYAAGTWTAAVRVKDTSGTVIHLSKVSVVAFPPAAFESVLRGVYTDMLDRLRAGDISGALTAMTDAVYDKYSAVFQALQPDLRTIVDQLGSVEDVTFGMDMAEYSIVRDTADGPQRFLIYLIRGADGIWRIEGM